MVGLPRRMEKHDACYAWQDLGKILTSVPCGNACQDHGKIMARSWQDNHGKTCKLVLIVHNLFFSQKFFVVCNFWISHCNNFGHNIYWLKIVFNWKLSKICSIICCTYWPSFVTWEHGIVTTNMTYHTKQTPNQVIATCGFAISVWKPTILAMICLELCKSCYYLIYWGNGF